MANAESPTASSAESAKLMRRATLFSLGTGCTLVLLKTVAWLMTGSLSMLSSLADSMLDVIASGLNVAAVRYSLQPPDKEHRFGHGKAEDLSTLAQSTFICGSGVFLIIEGIKRFITPEPIHNNSIGIGVMIISMLLTFILLSYQRRVIRKTASGAIEADAMHYFVDLLTSGSVILAFVLVTAFGWTAADSAVALGIAAYIMWSSFNIGFKAFQNLMDREFSDEERARIKEIVRTCPDALGLHDLRTRKSGIYRFIQFHLDLKEDITLKRAHEISDHVEDLLLQSFPNTDILIHQDPINGDRLP